MTTYTLKMRDDYGGSESETISAESLDEAIKMAKEQTEAWCRDGDWGDDGSIIGCHYSLENQEEVIASKSINVEIEPNHAALIHAACNPDTRDRCCGNNPDNHDWTSKGEGGCSENPGVWSIGGTTLRFDSHCQNCGLHRTEMHFGSQRNQGQSDTVAYDMPEKWCPDCQHSECHCRSH